MEFEIKDLEIIDNRTSISLDNIETNSPAAQSTSLILNELHRETEELQNKLKLNYRRLLLFETENNKLMEDLLQLLQPNTFLCVACDITLPTEFIKTKTIAEWKKEKVDLHNRPCIFIIHKM